MSEQPQAAADGPPQGEGFAWFHVTVGTYGNWLYGDARGFRTRHHREHVEGDYKSPPPPERYAERRRRSRESLKAPPVTLAPSWRPIVGRALVERFQGLGGFVLCAAMSGRHGHLLVKLPGAVGREWAGQAKRHAWFVARDAGWTGKLWGIRSRALPVKDRPHQVNAYHYILAHEEEGAWVWKWTKPSPGVAPPSPGAAPPGESAATPGAHPEG